MYGNSFPICMITENPVTFMVNSIKGGLAKAGFDVQPVAFNIDAVSAACRKSDLIIVYCEKSISTHSDVFTLVKDICLESEKKLFAIGYEDDIDELTKVLPDHIISERILRPLNMQGLVDKVSETVQVTATYNDRKHVLVVDDSGTLLRTIQSWLSPKYKVSLVNSGMAALSFLSKSIPDLILLDYEMPVCSGPQFMLMLLEDPTFSEIPVIFLTAKGDRESVKKALSLHPSGYLLKTSKSTDIVKAVDDFFEKTENPDL